MIVTMGKRHRTTIYDHSTIDPNGMYTTLMKIENHLMKPRNGSVPDANASKWACTSALVNKIDVTNKEFLGDNITELCSV